MCRNDPVEEGKKKEKKRKVGEWLQQEELGWEEKLACEVRRRQILSARRSQAGRHCCGKLLLEGQVVALLSLLLGNSPVVWA